MDFTYIGFGIIFLGAGIMFCMGKIHAHLSAWKTMPPSEKAQIKIKPLCLNIGTAIAVCGLIFLLGGLWQDFKERIFIWIMIIWIISVIIDVYHIQRSKYYKNNKY